MARPKSISLMPLLCQPHAPVGSYDAAHDTDVLPEPSLLLSGTGTVREHVQRLGRLLRKHGDKQALLYEVVTRDTGEEFTSDRRRQHHAYQ